MGSKSGLYTVVVLLSILRWSAGEDSALIEAFEYLERGKSRAYPGLLGQTTITAPRGVNITLLKREAELVDQIRVLTNGLAVASGEHQMVLPERANDTQRALNSLLDDIAQVAPEYMDLWRGEPASWGALQECLCLI